MLMDGIRNLTAAYSKCLGYKKCSSLLSTHKVEGMVAQINGELASALKQMKMG